MPDSSSSQSQSQSSSVKPRSSWGIRALRLLATAALSFAMSILLMIFLLAKAPPVREVVFADYATPEASAVCFTLLAFFVAFAAPLAVLIYGLRHGWMTWRIMGASSALVIGTIIYLAMDDVEVILPATLNELAPARPGDGESNKVVLRYAGKNPQDVLKVDDKIYYNGRWATDLNGKDTDAAILTQHRDEIETAWTQVAELHQWFTELSAFPRIGDLTQGAADAIPPFAVIRTYVRVACAKAELLALDGKGDEALGILRQVEDVAQKMQATSRSLVRIMIVMVMEKAVLDKVPFVLAHGETSPAARGQFATTLSAGLTGSAGARRMSMVEFVAITVPLVLNEPISPLLTVTHPDSPAHYLLDVPLKLIDPLLMNPRATVNLAGNYFSTLADKAAQRDIAGMTAQGDQFELASNGAVPIKNIEGRQILSMIVPVYAKVVAQYWKVQDEIDATLAKLKAIEATR